MPMTAHNPLLDQVTGPLASFTGDGAYDQDGVSRSVAKRHPDARVIVPPRSRAVPSEAGPEWVSLRAGWYNITSR